MKRYLYKDFIIDVLDEATYQHGSEHHHFNYHKVYFGNDEEQHPSSKHGIKIHREGQIIDSCIIIGSGGATGIHQSSSLMDNDQLIICCCDTIFCLMAPELNLKWKTQADQATCFQIFKLQKDYVVHGELQVTRLGKDGKILWQFAGKDIFVSLEGEEEFKLADDHIMLTDFGKTRYKIDFDGNLLHEASID